MNMRWLRNIILFSAFVCSTSAFAQVEKLQTMFIYNFTKHVEWPEAYRSGDFVIGVLGSSPITKELKELARNRKVGSQNIVIREYRDASQIGTCHILFLPEKNSGDIGNVLTQVKNNSTLIITNKPGMASAGAAINFVLDGNKQKFELKKSNATKYGLKVSSDLERLAIVVK